MDEKKLTDEEIVKALECCINDEGCDCGNCPYKNNDDCLHRSGEDSLDLIHRLQEQNGKLKTLVSHFEQLEKALSAEIERLTEESNEMFDRHSIENQAASLSIEKRNKENSELKKQVDKLTKENKRLTEENAELQKQVDELKDKLEKVLSGIKMDELLVAKGIEQTVKDMAKEILQELWDETEPLNESHKWVRLRIKNIASRKGVEVE